MKFAALCFLACLTYLGGAQAPEGSLPENQSPGAWLTGTYWYVPTAYLPAMLAVTSGPRIVPVSDQTVWHFAGYFQGYIYGIAATNIGVGWSYSLMVGSVTPDGSVKLSFSPLASANPKDPTTQAITIGDGTLRRMGNRASFQMQMTSGTASVSLTHWASMYPVTPREPEWHSLPGYPTTGVPDLTELNTPIAFP
jgi:hypothetical protein